MRIKNLRIESFGKLESVSIGLDDKITVISGKNEAGKSSIASFIKYMLYGFDSSKKSSVSENQKKKYMPWDGSDCSGELTFEAADKNTYTAVRRTATRSQNTVLDANDMPLTGDDAGEYFFGINENCYKKTAFIGQRDAAFTDDGELDSAIRNMVYSADESVDSQKALKKLEEIRKHYLGKAERSGEIYELEKELETLISERDKWKDGHKDLLSSEHQLAEIQKKIAFNKEKKQQLTKEKQNLEYLEAKQKLSQIEDAKKIVESGKAEFEAHYKQMQNGSFVPDAEYLQSLISDFNSICEQNRRVNDCQSAFDSAKENLDGLYSDKMQKNISDALDKNDMTAEGLLEKVSDTRKKISSSKKLAIILTCLIVTIPVAVFFYIKSSRLKKELSSIAEMYGCEDIETLEKYLIGKSAFESIENAAKRSFEDAAKNFDAAKEKCTEMIEEYTLLASKGGATLENVKEYIETLKKWLSETESLKAKCREDFVAYNTLISSVNMDELREMAGKFDESIEVRDVKTVSQQLAFYTQANEGLEAKERELEKTAAVLSGTLPKPSEIQSRILSLSARRDELRFKHSSLCLAIETLEKASENMRSEASPRIAAETSKLFSKVTDGKYRALYTDGEMKLSFLERDGAEVRDAGYLSAGTLDAAYISLRVALCEFLYKEHPTLIFDDAFANMDDERLHNTLDFLRELSEDFQIIILSCHDREKKYLEGKAKIIEFAI